MIRCPNCKKAHAIVHPSVNRCSCGYGFDGNGKKIDANIPHVVFKQVPEKVTGSSDYRDKPGTALKSLIPEWFLGETKNCGCRDFERKMNEYGVTGCEGKHFEEIVEHLMNQRKNLKHIFRIVPMSVQRIAVKRLVTDAIELAKK